MIRGGELGRYASHTVLVAGGDEFCYYISRESETVGTGAKDADCMLVKGVKGGVGTAADNVIIEVALNINIRILHYTLRQMKGLINYKSRFYSALIATYVFGRGSYCRTSPVLPLLQRQ